MIIGRKHELQMLKEIYDSNRGEFVIVYGRRRVGKTFLVRNAFHNDFAFHVTGLFCKPKKKQLENFANALSEYSGMDVETPKDWYVAFRMLKEYLKSLGNRKMVVFIDEMPWMATPKSDFVGALESFWNSWGAGVDGLKLIVCGSASSWFADNIFSNKGGLFNRDTARIYLHPFNLHETEEYMHSQGIVMNRYEIVECYMIMGGIPYYLSKLNKGYSLAQNVDRLFFQPKALLFDEFAHLYDALFNKSADYVKVVEALANKRYGLTQSEIAKLSGIPQGGNFSKILENLTYSDIIYTMHTYGNAKREVRYLLRDFYTQFYFSFIKNNETKDPAYWSNRLDEPGHDAWRGLSYERVCMDHLQQIKMKLGIAGVATSTSSFYKNSTPDAKGAQIDIVIDRKDQIINLCEVKFSKSEFSIDKKCFADLSNKIEVYVNRCKPKSAVHMTMITTYGLKKSKYDGIVQSSVTMDDLFVD